MKNLARILPLVFLSFILILSSCGESSGAKSSSAFEGYVIVREENPIDISAMQKLISAGLGSNIELRHSYIGAGMTETEKEILIGNTGRAESTAAIEGLRSCDYTIAAVGSKIVIAGGSADATYKAVKYFTENMLSEDGKSVSIPEGGYTVKNEYLFDSLSIGGVDISEFSFYNKAKYSDPTAAFTYFADSAVGVKIPTVKELSKDGHYIIYDDSSFMAGEYEVKLEGGNLIILGSYNTAQMALDHFKNEYLTTLSSKNKNYNITEADNTLTTVAEYDIYTKDQLYEALELVYEDNSKFIIGEEGNKITTAKDTMQHFFEGTGKYPALLGNDLGCYGLDLMDQNKSFWSKAICEYVEYAAQGGIVTFSSHWRNPTGNYTHDWADCRGELGHEEKWIELLTEGTELNLEFKKQLDTDALFLKGLMDNGVPIIWRPMHEQNGSFFWWCIEQEDGYVLNPSYFVNLWKYVYEYFTEDWGLTNLLWEFGPNKTNGRNYEDVLYCYPGDDYCDMVSLDWYTAGNYEIADAGKSYERLMSAGKITNMGEFGIGDELETEDPANQERVFSSMNLLEDVILRMVDEDGYKMAYLMTWTGRDSLKSLMRGEQMMKSGYIIDLTEMKSIFDSLK